MKVIRVAIVALGVIAWSAIAAPQQTPVEPSSVMKTAAVRQATQPAVLLDIPSQPMERALQTFAAQSGLQVIFPTELTRAITSPEIKGTYAPEVALKILLADTALRFEYVNARTVAIHPAKANAARSSPAPNGTEPVGEEQRALNSSPGDAPAPTSTTTETGRNGSTASEGGDGRTASEEIVVTARRREERLQDVPISIAVVSADEIDRRGLFNAADYLRGIPGVNQVEAPFGQTIVIRGLETSPAFQNFSAGTTAATYFGETPTTNSSGLAGGTNIDLKLVDIERVEVLRGPQGTAFGSSSLGGVVRTIPVAPKLDRFEGKIAAGYSATSDIGDDNYNVRAIGNLPLIQDRLAVRAVAYQYEDSGFHRNVAASDAAFLAARVVPFGGEASAVNEEEVGSYYVLGGRFAALFQPAETLNLTLSYLKQRTETDGYPLQNSGPYEQVMLQVAPEHADDGRTGGFFDTDIDLANATIEYDLAWANVLAAYSHIKGASDLAQPGTYFGLTTFSYPYSSAATSEHRGDIAELRLTTDFEGNWNFITGLYREDLDDDYRLEQRWHGDDVSLSPPTVNPLRTVFMGETSQRRNVTQEAAYGEISWKFLPRFTLTGGARAYEFERTQHRLASGSQGVADELRATDASGTSFSSNLSYQLNSTMLAYADWSQGFRLGKPQTGLVAQCDLNTDGLVDGSSIAMESTRHIDSDDVDSYELGTKLALLDSRVNLAVDVFRVDWTNVPIRATAPLPPAGCGRAYTANVGSARSEGVELEANIRMTDAFSVNLGISRINARLTEDALGLAPPAFEGARLPGSPKVNANLSLEHRFNIAGYPVSVRADSSYVGPFHGDLQESANTRAGDYVKVDAGARIVVRNLNIDVFARNLTNADDFVYRDTIAILNSFGYRLRPRTVGLQLGYEF